MEEQKEQSTLERIHAAAKAEFMEKGFHAASLRNIVKTAGVTTGAFYGYYDSKEALFEALVGDAAEYVLNLYCGTIDDFEKMVGQEQTRQMTDVSQDVLMQILDYIYENKDAFKLILTSAEGTKYSDFIHQLVVREVESTYTYMETLKKMGHPVEPLNRNLIHMVASGMFSGVCETIIHDMPKEEAKEYLMQLHRFYSAGWEELLGVRFGKESKESE